MSPLRYALPAALALAGCARSAQPDVLLVVVDTLRADRLGAYGFSAPVSPNVDALAARGVVFERAIAASTKTAPSVSSLLTSRWLGRLFVHGHASTPDLARIPLVLVAPGLAAGRRNEVVHHVDVVPTVLELAGAPPLESSDGLALGPYLRAGESLPERTVFCDAGTDLAAYSADRYFRFWLTLGGGPGAQARQGTFRWGPGIPPRLVPQDDGLARKLEEYRGTRTKVRYHGAALSDEDVARLRALGYAVPEREEH